MSRIDDALRRAGNPSAGKRGSRREPSLEPFQSPWSGMRSESKEPVVTLEAVKAPLVKAPSLVGDYASASTFDFAPDRSERLALPDQNPQLRDQFGKLA